MSEVTFSAAYKAARGLPLLTLARTQKQFRFYGDFSERLVGEIVTSYVAFCGHLMRKRAWDDIFREH